MNDIEQRTSTALAGVLMDYLPDWTQRNECLNRLMEVLYPRRSVSARLDMVSALADIMQLDPILNRGRLEKLANTLIQQHYPPDLLRRAYVLSPDSPWGRDWRSEKGTVPPSERALRDTLAQFSRQARRDDVVDLDE